jgi:adhesin transport system outer membrane protein
MRCVQCLRGKDRRIAIRAASSFVALMTFQNAIAQDAAENNKSENPEYFGSLYPEDLTVTAYAQADEPGAKKPATMVVERAAPSTALEKALGPAGYIVHLKSLNADFAAMIRKAVGTHPAYHAQASTLDESRAERRRARAALYPQLSTQFRGDYAIKRDFAADTDNVVESLRPREQFTAGVSASQLVFDGGATFQRIKSAKARDSEYKNALETRINDLSFNALAAYHDLATHQALVALGEAYIARHEKILRDVEERERLGAGSKADVTRAIARLAAAKARVAEIRESKRLAEIRYEELFGKAPVTLARPSFDDVTVETREEAAVAAVNNNPELAAAAARADALRAEYKAAKGARLPEVRLSVDAVKYDVFQSGDDFDVRAGVNLSYNIFSGGARGAEIAAAGSRARRERFNEDQVRQEISRDAEIAFEMHEGADERLEALETAVIAHNETRELVLERYRVARGDLIDVLQSENDYFEAGVAYLTGLANSDMAVYALMEHTGDLLRLFSPQYDYDDAVSEGLDG